MPVSMTGDSTRIPDFAKGSELLEGAYRMALEAHEGPRSEGDTGIQHPVEVARILSAEGFGEEVVAAALLHDVVEDSDTSAEELEERFGAEVAGLVREMTEDESIEPYEARKAEHRDRVARDRSVAAIYGADKIVGTREMKGSDELPDEKLGHYRETLRTLCRSYPDLPFLGELRRELDELCAQRARR
jgi:(p)ppGpp synthase/HD superfamily hydrolase